ncbi:Ca2+-binding EF-hand superfamily protein [Allocatelliglobosispora scoriae]|uniref:Ca2+-binding EF-hand superfamily protein n=1 Tax=Allocatelliglobosispora scoriae TaxID=643052 RepID=A0A841BKV9_9ACTN|nr:EF-hand domain-containing protein [Allocatelliglobosispora scoriae]MBB5867440.1 Ca2+-binding EF-hand superfamily protein [Allocatelliglobosispora scoriae]
MQRKHRLAFSHFDRDHNGYIERTDLEGLGVRILSQFEDSPTSAKGKAVVGSFDGIWAALAQQCDKDADGRIDPAEYHRGMTEAFVERPADYEQTFRPAVKAVLDLADVDGDGALSRDEFVRIQNAFGTADDQIDEAFRRMDTDGDGRLTVEELTEAVRQFYVGTQDDAVGNWFFGAS